MAKRSRIRYILRMINTTMIEPEIANVIQRKYRMRICDFFNFRKDDLKELWIRMKYVHNIRYNANSQENIPILEVMYDNPDSML